jgi:hypothetical protein
MKLALALLPLLFATVAYAGWRNYHYETLYELNGVNLVESINDYSHQTGDPGATVDSVHVYMQNMDGQQHTLRVSKLELLHAHCNAQKWADRKPLPIRGDLELSLFDDEGTPITGKDKVVMPAQKEMFSLHASFRSIQVYNECDRFALGMSFEVDGKVTPIELEMKVTRHEPCPN